MNFKLNYPEAINALLECLKEQGQEADVISRIKKAGKYLYHRRGYNNLLDFNSFARIALYIKNSDDAFTMLSHFGWSSLDRKMAQSLATLQQSYGVDWCIALLNHWQQKDKPLVVPHLDAWVSEFVQHQGSSSIAEFILNAQASAMIKTDPSCHSRWITPRAIRERLPERLAILQQLLVAGSTLNAVSVVSNLIEYVISQPHLYPEIQLAELLITLQAVLTPDCLVGCQPLKDYLIQGIGRELALGMRSQDDWSIAVSLSCQCEACKTAKQFLHSATEVSKIWPIVTATREHVMDALRDLDLPVNLSVEKKGSPYKLVMVKNALLHQNARVRFEQLKDYHQRLLMG